jgi:CRISPR type II-A-associated protein Csn2
MIKASIFGIDSSLEINEGEIGLLNIHNKAIYRKIVKLLLNDFDKFENNEIVFIKEGERLLSNQIEYIHDINLYNFNSKKILDEIIKRLNKEINQDTKIKISETENYIKLINPLLEELNILEIDYEYKNELDLSFYSKIPGISFKVNDELDPLEKIMAIININLKLFNKKIYIFNSAIKSLTNEEIILLNDYVEKTNITLLLLDYLDDCDVVITKNLCINHEFGVYSIKNDII